MDVEGGHYVGEVAGGGGGGEGGEAVKGEESMSCFRIYFGFGLAWVEGMGYDTLCLGGGGM